MRMMLHALVGALFVHIVYMGIMLMIGWIKTKQYEPQFSPGDIVLQSEVSFGFVGSPLVFLSSYISVTVILGCVLIAQKQMKRGVL